MATDADLVDALRKAAEALVGRKLTSTESDDLIKRFNAARGSYQDRAREAIKGFAGLDDPEFRRRVKASDNTDRLINDLNDTIGDWKPGT